MSTLLLDLRTAFRCFLRRRAATAVAVTTLALALGANTAVFSVLHAFLFASLALPEAERLHVISSTRELPGRGRVEFYNAWPAGELLRTESRAFSAVGALQFSDFIWDEGDGGEPRRLLGARASTGVFAAWGLQPALGRLFREDEEGLAAAPVAVISHRLWQSGFVGARDVVGRTLRLNGRPHTIVGVLPEGFSQPSDTDVWLPQEIGADLRSRGFGPKLFALYARLAPGVTPAAAQEELRRLSARAAELDAANRDWTFRSRPLREVLLDGSDRALLLVQAGALVLLLLAISNVASLQLAWAAERQTETAVRLALGAPARRIVRLFLAQSLLLCGAGGVLGVLLAWFAVPVWQRLNPSRELDFLLQNLDLNLGSLGFAAALILATGLAAGLLPAWQVRRANLVDSLKSGGRAGTASRANLRGQQAMAVVQAAVTVIVLSSAALTGWNFHRLNRVPAGFAAEERAVLRVQLPPSSHPTGAERARFALRLLDEAAKQGELRAVAVTTTLPVDDVRQRTGFAPEGADGVFTEDPVPLHTRGVSPGYLATMGIPLLRGRDLTAADLAPDAPRVAVISQIVADKHWPGSDALGRRLRRSSGSTAEFFEIVGIAANVQDAGPAGPPGETIYLPLQHTAPRRVSVVLHGRTMPAAALTAGRAALRAADPALAAFAPARLDELAARANALPRLQTVLLGVFAAVAAGIAMLGSYGIMSQLVASREREFAVRLALGAEPAQLFRATLAQNARLGLLGAALGVGGAWAAGAGLRGLLPGLGEPVAWVYAAVALATLGLMQAATLAPAWRGLKVDVRSRLAGD